ncbi:PREDICTED: feather keratin Cos2-3-like [Tauraco erythrolophus]|nr:PREDICTED: feather keratin Cos2-3-like [Tauraco erythrolophus]
MSCYDQCLPCQPCGPTPLANSCNKPCVRQCQNSTVVIQPSSVVVILPAPILTSFPQNTVVGSSTSAAVGSILSSDGVPINSGCCDLSGISGSLFIHAGLLAFFARLALYGQITRMTAVR